MTHLPRPTAAHHVRRCPLSQANAEAVDAWATPGADLLLPPVLGVEALGWAWEAWRLVYPDCHIEGLGAAFAEPFEGMMSDLVAAKWSCTALARLVWRYARRVEAIEVLRELGDGAADLWHQLHLWALGDAAALGVDLFGRVDGWSAPMVQAALSEAVELVARIDKTGGGDAVAEAFVSVRSLVYALDQLDDKDRVAVVDYLNGQLAALALVVSSGALVRQAPTPRAHPSQAIRADAIAPSVAWRAGLPVEAKVGRWLASRELIGPIDTPTERVFYAQREADIVRAAVLAECGDDGDACD